MNILVCPNTMIVGGSALVALDLAAAMQERGHRVVVFGAHGPLVERVEPLGLEWIESPGPDRGSTDRTATHGAVWPSLAAIRQIRHIVSAEQIDVVHTYEWLRCLEAAYGAQVLSGVPHVSSILAVRAPRFLPRCAHLVVGTQDLAEVLQRRGYPAVTLIEPRLDRVPVNQHPDVEGFTTEHGLDPGLPKIVVASRLSGMKVEGIRHAIDAVALLDETLPVQLVIAGRGSSQDELHERGARVNDRLGRPAVVFTGVLMDLAPAYACADVVVGMGTAVLGGMAQGKPAIVVGQDGFSELLTEETAPALGALGFWGVGRPEGATDRLAGHIAEALSDPDLAAELSAVSLEVVAQRPTKEQTDDKIEGVYRDAVAAPPAAERVVAVTRSFGRFAGMRARARLRRRLGR